MTKSDDQEIDALELQAFAAQDAYRLAIAKNIATNGRLFCLILAVANVMAASVIGVVFCALPVGISVIADQCPAGRLRNHLSNAAICSAVGVFLATLINAW